MLLRMGPDRYGIQAKVPAELSKVRISLDQNRLVATMEELNSGSSRRALAEVRSLLTKRLVTKVELRQAKAARRLGVSTPAIAKALKATRRK